MNKLIKRIAFDATGIFLIIVAVPIGWLPGPGGIPLALIGLGLLARNNQWARDLLDDFENKFKYYSDKITHAPPKWQLSIDFFGLAAFITSIYLIVKQAGFLQIFGTALVTSSLIILLINRGRGDRVYNKFKRNKP